MKNEIHEQILNIIKQKSRVKAKDIVNITGFSRAYIHRKLSELIDDSKIILIGKANQAHYILSGKNNVKAFLPLKTHKILNNYNLTEHIVLRKIKMETGIFNNLIPNVSSILDYAFSEILNNAIEHSKSEKVDIVMKKTENKVEFKISDKGIGIFKNIMTKKNLNTEIDAVQDLLKGKETTAPSKHSGEGIFFTSRIADFFTIKSFEKMLVFDNIINDVFVKNAKSFKGTSVDFTLNPESDKNLAELFSRYTDESFQFNRTEVKVKLYKYDVDYVSRSQARRLISGLDKFNIIELDFKDLDTIGQAFADEIFRIWVKAHKDKKLIVKNVNENIRFMINRVKEL